LLLIEAIKTLHESNVKTHGFEIARFVTCALSGLVDQLVDWNSRLSMWIPQNEQVGRGLCGPGVAMLWDYAETDPVMKGPSNLHAKLNRIVRGAEALKELPSPVKVSIGSAMDLPYPDGFFDAVITDPPYYDNVFYAPLADFIYPWKRMLLEDITPEFFKCELTDGDNELVSSTIRAGSSEKAHARYCTMLNRAITEIARVLRKDGIFSLVYSHASVNGWSALVEAFQRSNFTVQSAQPLAMTSEAVNTCIVFVSHLNGQKKIVTHNEAIGLVKARLNTDFLKELTSLGWSENDAGIALFAGCLIPLCNISFSNLNIRELVAKAGELVSTVCPGFKLVNRRSL
jgi:putative DNA methylase